MVTDPPILPVAPDSRPYWRVVALLVGALLLLSFALAWLGQTPPARARRLAPAPGELVSVQPSLRVQFARPIDKSSVEGKVFISPAVPFELSWADQELRILPQGALLAETDYSVTIGPGLRDAYLNEMRGTVSWTFRTRQPRIAFIRFSEAMLGEVWLSDLMGEKEERLSAPGQAVQSFDSAPDGSLIVYTVEEGANTVNLWKLRPGQGGMTRLTEEPGIVYGSPRFGPSGDLLAVERREVVQIGDQGEQLAPPRVELRRPLDGSPAGEVYGGQGAVGHSPRWSPDGTRIAFFEANENAIGLFNFTPDHRFFPAESALVGPQAWSPDGRTLVYTSVLFTARGAQQSVIVRDLQMGTEFNMGESVGDQADPAWSPDGDLIAYAYKPPMGLDRGGGIWLMRPDGSGRVPLVTEPDVIFSLPLWSPDGQWLLFGRFDLRTPDATQSIWAVRRNGSDLHLVSEDGFQPIWVP